MITIFPSPHRTVHLSSGLWGCFEGEEGHFGCPVSVVDPCLPNDSKNQKGLKYFKLTKTFLLDLRQFS